jgi:hypothetical protein
MRTCARSMPSPPVVSTRPEMRSGARNSRSSDPPAAPRPAPSQPLSPRTMIHAGRRGGARSMRWMPPADPADSPSNRFDQRSIGSRRASFTGTASMVKARSGSVLWTVSVSGGRVVRSGSEVGSDRSETRDASTRPFRSDGAAEEFGLLRSGASRSTMNQNAQPIETARNTAIGPSRGDPLGRKRAPPRRTAPSLSDYVARSEIKPTILEIIVGVRSRGRAQPWACAAVGVRSRGRAQPWACSSGSVVSGFDRRGPRWRPPRPRRRLRPTDLPRQGDIGLRANLGARAHRPAPCSWCRSNS